MARFLKIILFLLFLFSLFLMGMGILSYASQNADPAAQPTLGQILPSGIAINTDNFGVAVVSKPTVDQLQQEKNPEEVILLDQIVLNTAAQCKSALDRAIFDKLTKENIARQMEKAGNTLEAWAEKLRPKSPPEPIMVAEELPQPEEPEGELLLPGNEFHTIYFAQDDPRWAKEIYGGDNTLDQYGCGPTALAMVVSTLTGEITTPDDMAEYAYENGFFANNSGSYHSIIPKGAQSFGLNTWGLTDYTPQAIKEQLEKGNLLVALMKKGHFATEGHFILLRGITEDGKLLVADPKSMENTQSTWDASFIINQLKFGANSGGPLWVIEKNDSASNTNIQME